jgi:hypothetical protein
MSTEEIRQAFHSAFEPVVGSVIVDPAMSSVVRRRYAREQRLLTVGAAFGVAAVTASAAVGALTIHSGNGHPDTPAAQDGGSPTSRPTPTPESWQTVSLVGHEVSLPSDWTLSGNRELIDLDTIEPAQPVGGKTQSVTATSPDGTRRFEATVYTGPIADAERAGNSADDDPTFIHVTINGLDALIKVTGPATECLYPSTHESNQGQADHASKHAGPGLAKQPDSAVLVGPCPTPDPAEALYGVGQYTFGNGDFMMVDTQGMDSEALASFLTTALSN